MAIFDLYKKKKKKEKKRRIYSFLKININNIIKYKALRIKI